MIMTDLAAIVNTYQAWVDTIDPVKALNTWSRVTLQANNSADRNGINRRERAGQITALKRAIERATGYRLTLESRSYSEEYGFRHASYFIYTISRPGD
jgi:hypothetical protein